MYFKTQKITTDTKIFKSITEVSEEINIEKHVLRFWENEFVQLKPRRHYGKRYYSPDDIKLILKIRYLLHEKKYTISGAKKKLSNIAHSPLYNDLQKLNNKLQNIFLRIKENLEQK